MNYLLHRQNVPHKTAKIPEGLNDLMADISREVLRQQPDQNSIYEYIADYLEALIGTRERAEAIQMIINEQIENTERVRAILRKSGISIDKAEMAARIIQESYKNFVKQKKKKQSIAACDMFDEIAVLRELITKCNLTADEIVKARPAVKKAYREFIDGYMNAMKASLLGQKVVPLSLVAKIFLDVPSMRQVDRNACVIQSAYRAYLKRKSLRFTSANIKVFLEKIKKRKRDALIAEKTIRLRTTHLDENETMVVKEFQKQYEENVVKQIEAATLIQKVYRGYFIRKDIKLEHTRLVVERQKSSKSMMALVDDEDDIQDIFLKGGQDTLADSKSIISLSDMSDADFQQQINELDLAIKELDAQEQYRNYDREEEEILKRDLDEQVDEHERAEEYELYTIKEDKEKEEELAIALVQQDEGNLSDTTEINTERMQAGDIFKRDRDTEEELASEGAKIFSGKEDDLQSNLSTDYLDTDRMQEEYEMREYMEKDEDLQTRIVVENLEISQDLEPDDSPLPTERMFAGDATKEAIDIINEALTIDDDIDNDDVQGIVEYDAEIPVDNEDTERSFKKDYEKEFKGEKPFVFPADVDREFDLEDADTNDTTAENIEEKKPEAVNNLAGITKKHLQEVSGSDDVETTTENLSSDDDIKSVDIQVSTAEYSSSEKEQSKLATVIADGKKELEVPAPVEEVLSIKEQPDLATVAEEDKKELEVPAPVEEGLSLKEHLATVAQDSKKELDVTAPVEEVLSVKEKPELVTVAEDSKKELEETAPVEDVLSVKERSEDNQKELEVIDNIEDVEKKD